MLQFGGFQALHVVFQPLCPPSSHWCYGWILPCEFVFIHGDGRHAGLAIDVLYPPATVSIVFSVLKAHELHEYLSPVNVLAENPHQSLIVFLFLILHHNINGDGVVFMLL